MARMCGLDVKQLIMHMICTKYMHASYTCKGVGANQVGPAHLPPVPAAALPRTGLPPSTGPFPPPPLPPSEVNSDPDGN